MAHTKNEQNLIQGLGVLFIVRGNDTNATLPSPPNDLPLCGPRLTLDSRMLARLSSLQTAGPVCEWEHVEMTCPHGRVIDTISVFYGRDDVGTCGFDGFTTDTMCSLSPTEGLDAVAAWCDGLRSCEFQVTNAFFGADPCYLTFKSATVEYRCKSAKPL